MSIQGANWAPINMNIWKAIVLIMLLLASPFSPSHASDNAKPIDLDLLVLNLVKDVQDHVLYIQVLKNNNPDLRDLLVSNLSTKIFDINHYIAGIKNTEVIKIACDSSIRLQGDFQKITSNCKNDRYYELCREVYLWYRMCLVKQ
jgi:hypothetical protein